MSTTSCADLEIKVSPWYQDRLDIGLRFRLPPDYREIRILKSNRVTVPFDYQHLNELMVDTPAYGEVLSQSLFGDPEFNDAFQKAHSAAESQNLPLRVRLFLDPYIPQLHALHWEKLLDPRDHSSLLTRETILFSRYLDSSDWTRPQRQRKTELRALVVVADPEDITSYAPNGRTLTPLDMPGELERAKESLAEISVTDLPSKGRATFNNIIDTLRDGYDILYIVCHGALVNHQALLWLEDDDGKASRIDANEFIAGLRGLQHRPRLVVLASCQSGGDGKSSSRDDGALAALGPRLTEIIPAVVAMQENIQMDSVAKFMPRFFKELLRDGLIDRAMAVARAALGGQPDWWVPTLFMRLADGRMWYTPGFADHDATHNGDKDEERLGKWPTIIQSIKMKKCTPILGPGLTENIFGNRRHLALRWAEKYNFPLAAHARDDLPRVAQYLSVSQDRPFLRNTFTDYLHEEILSLHEGERQLVENLAGKSLSEQITDVGKWHREHDDHEPHKILAERDLSVYITTDPSDLLADALRAAGKTPHVDFFRWKPKLRRDYPLESDTPRPSINHPLVYHLFGRLEYPESLLLTEDDHLDYLIYVTAYRDEIPKVVRSALSSASLLFVGFQIDDWIFRVLFRSIINQEGSRFHDDDEKYTSVAAQIEPEEDRILVPQRAREYLENYYLKGANISIYWGNVEDFMRDLERQCKANR